MIVNLCTYSVQSGVLIIETFPGVTSWQEERNATISLVVTPADQSRLVSYYSWNCTVAVTKTAVPIGASQVEQSNTRETDLIVIVTAENSDDAQDWFDIVNILAVYPTQQWLLSRDYSV